ncbi:MAG TPA: hypothetical protein PLU71_01960 [Candidatus Dependentiae bacterium]|nr:hypothetical protein [Candidatus Dependentiae bacterium]HRQ62596.1 hypothetical protein [Candidatus Dependentiae bacterium]
MKKYLIVFSTFVLCMSFQIQSMHTDQIQRLHRGKRPDRYPLVHRFIVSTESNLQRIHNRLNDAELEVSKHRRTLRSNESQQSHNETELQKTNTELQKTNTELRKEKLRNRKKFKRITKELQQLKGDHDLLQQNHNELKLLVLALQAQLQSRATISGQVSS